MLKIWGLFFVVLVALMVSVDSEDYECYRGHCLLKESDDKECFCVKTCNDPHDCEEGFCFEECYDPQTTKDALDYYLDAVLKGNALNGTTKDGLNGTDIYNEILKSEGSTTLGSNE
ncbi:hypothetical protein C0J52_17998 [Blattella germanica]|nr:hypothetical protein C0J52_17998 [Blattella germanica]